MVISIYCRKEDKWLLDKVDEICVRERKSRSAVILSILERYFEQEKRVGEILQDMGFVSLEQLQEALEFQKEKGIPKKIGEILKEKGIVTDKHLQKALGLQIKNEDRE